MHLLGEIMKNNWKTFLSLCIKAKDEKEIEKIFDFFLTIDEKENIADRLSITKALLDGDITQRDIAKKMHVSIVKITRGSNMLKQIDPSFKTFLLENL